MVLLACGAAAAQTSGRIEGVVRDGAGGVLSGAAVSATSPNLQGVRAATTGAGGRFQLLALPPGVYRVRAERFGFRPAEKPVTVTLDATSTAEFALEPAVEAQVSVTGEAPLIDATSTTQGTSYTSRVVSHLPTGRNYSDIVQANPGVSTDRGDSQGRSIPLTIYGATSTENQWIIDGVNTTNVLKGFQGKALSTEFVQEVEVKTGGYQAEYGGALGGVVNVVTKSGGNEYHGDAFAYYDSTQTAAAQQFGPGFATVGTMRIADGERLDFGADFGGYLWKDTLWFFAAYDHVDFQGDVSRLTTAGPVSKDDRFPLATKDNLYSGKLTWNAAPSTTIVAVVFADPSTNTGAGGADPRQGVGSYYVRPITSPDPATWSSARSLGGTDYGLQLSRLLGSHGIVTFQGALHRDRNGLAASNRPRYEDRTCTPETPGGSCTPPVEPDFVSGGYGLILGPQDHFESQRAQGRGDVTLYGSGHEFQAGVEYQSARTSSLGFYSGGQLVTRMNDTGQYYFEHDFVAASPDPPTPIEGGPRQTEIRSFTVYAQDSWKPAPGVTVNVGLRWDGQETDNYLGQTVLRLYSGWQPRIGVVWDPWGDGGTKVFGFVGRFDYALPTALVLNSFANPTLLRSYNFDPLSVEQAEGVFNHPDVTTINTGAFGDPVDAGLRPAYQDELTLGVERLVGKGLTVGLKGTYRRLGAAIEDRCDFDAASPETDHSNCAIVNPGSDGRYARGDAPTCSGLDGGSCGLPRGPATPAASRTYRGIEVFARQSVSDGLWLQASYVYSSLRGNYDGGVNQSFYGQTSPGFNNDFNYPELWHDASGTLSLDRTNRFRLDAYWPSPWRLWVGFQAFVETGAPLNRLGYFNEDLGASIYLVPRGSAGRLPTLWEGNLTLGYPIAVGPATVTLQAYLFNMFNNQIVTSRNEEWTIGQPDGYSKTIYEPNQQPRNPSYGLVTSRSAPRSFRAAVRVSF